MGAADLWNDPKNAQKVIAELKVLRAQVEPLEGVIKDFEDAKVGYEMAKEAGDADLLSEVDESLFRLQARMAKVERQSLLSGKHDFRNCFVNIQAGAGGVEAEDWAGMLERMYLYYWNEMGWKPEEMHRSPGAEAGVSEVSYLLQGPFAFGYMSCERGTHRLARVSPFNAEGKRQTSFATVDVSPEFEEADLEIPARDLEIVPFVRASGPGGQNVNKVATAVHLIHEPTGIEVRMQETRSQLQNREKAWRLLRARVHDRRLAEAAAKRGEQRRSMIGGGERAEKIRTYRWKENVAVDHRVEQSFNLQKLLAGEVEALTAALEARDVAERIERL